MIPQTLRWENPLNDRYYIAYITRDLFNPYVVVKQWGSRTRRGSKVRSLPCDSVEHAMKILQNIAKRRIMRGYILV